MEFTCLTSCHQPCLHDYHHDFGSSHWSFQYCLSKNQDQKRSIFSLYWERNSHIANSKSCSLLDCSKVKQKQFWEPKSWNLSCPQSRYQKLPKTTDHSSSIGPDQALLTQVRVIATNACLWKSVNVFDLVGLSRDTRPRISSPIKRLTKANSLQVTCPWGKFPCGNHPKNLLGALK